MRLQGKVAIVTGSTKGIGKAIAIGYAKEGATVIVCGRSEDLAKGLADELTKQGHKAVAMKMDVTSMDSINQVMDDVVRRFGRIDILVNNAGISPIWKRAEDTGKDAWDQIIATNLTGAFLCAQAVGNVMIKQKSGKIINMTSVGGEVALPRLVAYCASKAGIISLTQVLAAEWAQHNILVNAIGPSYVETEFTAGLRGNERIYDELKSKNLLKRFAQPEEIVGTALFLASDESNYITGQTIFVDGGWLCI
ncbi:MAG TPA: 3-oxoacyl-ACP reductase family protein [Dehalococcoidia bacterium]|nr:3-oxoacyl-ACP reductase family protein [Dehalococcoidia bacterium]